jgi:threonine aldolase
LLRSIGEPVVPDVYGEGGVVAELESMVAELLGFPAAVFLPSGTMAQAATLRVHADERGRRTVLWHPMCHLDTHEGDAYSRVHALVGRAAASAFHLLRERLAEMPERLVHARAISAALADVHGVRVVPDPPQTPMMHLLFAVPAEQFVVNARRLADEQGIWVWPRPMPTGDPGVVRCELSVGRATCRLEPEQVAATLQALCRAD